MGTTPEGHNLRGHREILNYQAVSPRNRAHSPTLGISSGKAGNHILTSSVTQQALSLGYFQVDTNSTA